MEVFNYRDIVYLKQVNTNMGANISVYLYLVDGLLIDCGPEIMEKYISEFLLNQPISQLAITHLHEDHCGMAPWVQKNLHIPIYLHPDDIEAAGSDGVYAQYRHLTWRDRKAFDATPMPKIINTAKYSFEVIETAGHMPNHCLLYERNEGWLFSADLYVRSKIRFCAADENIKQYIESLKSVLKLDFDTVFCAHAGVLEDGKEKLASKLQFLEELQQKVLELRCKGLTDEDINTLLFPGEQLITAVSDGEWDSRNIIRTIL